MRVGYPAPAEREGKSMGPRSEIPTTAGRNGLGFGLGLGLVLALALSLLGGALLVVSLP
jgi:hypothetical protein